jgi:PleD family two-component response regulator
MDKPFALIIEDTQEIADLYGAMLNLLGFNAKLATTRLASIDLLASLKPQLVLLDLKLQGDLAGVELMKVVRTSKHLSNTIVVVITGHHQLTESVQESADLVLLKPVDIRQVGHVILRLCSEQIGYNQSLVDPKSSRLFTRAAFLDRLATNLYRAVIKPGHVFAVLLFDIRIETANDAISASDLQTQIAERIIRRSRIEDCCARFGDNRFGVMLSGIDKNSNAGVVARRLRDAVQEPIVLDDQQFTAVARIGLSLGTGEYSAPDEVIEEAQQGLELAIVGDDDSGIMDADGLSF